MTERAFRFQATSAFCPAKVLKARKQRHRPKERAFLNSEVGQVWCGEKVISVPGQQRGVPRAQELGPSNLRGICFNFPQPATWFALILPEELCPGKQGPAGVTTRAEHPLLGLCKRGACSSRPRPMLTWK